jgi:putative spermidine/putrescine transport system ATP-binding protein
MLGPSGSGKTTTLRMIAGFELPTSGRIILHGRDVTGAPPFERDVNTVFQDYALFPHMSVLENVAYGLKIRKVGRTERRSRAQAALEMVRLHDVGGRRPNQLSGGQRQRVALARAIVNRPRVLLLDEPLGALDLKLREEMQLELKSLQRRLGITFVYVTHDQGEALSMSDRVAVFDRGRIEQLAAPQELYLRPHTAFVARFVGSSNVFEGALAERLAGSPAPFAVRPERMQVQGPADPVPEAHLGCEGTLLDVQFHGATRRWQVDVDGRVLAAEPRDVEPQAPGTRVRLVWPRAAMAPLETQVS